MPVPMIISVVGRKPRLSVKRLSHDDNLRMIMIYGLSFIIHCDVNPDMVHSQNTTVQETATTGCSTSDTTAYGPLSQPSYISFSCLATTCNHILVLSRLHPHDWLQKTEVPMPGFSDAASEKPRLLCATLINCKRSVICLSILLVRE